MYVRASIASGIALNPDSLRTVLLKARLPNLYVASFSQARSIVERFEKMTETQVRGINKMIGTPVFELMRPILLTSILDKCETKEEIPDAILRQRNPDGAKGSPREQSQAG